MVFILLRTENQGASSAFSKSVIVPAPLSSRNPVLSLKFQTIPFPALSAAPAERTKAAKSTAIITDKKITFNVLFITSPNCEIEVNTPVLFYHFCALLSTYLSNIYKRHRQFRRCLKFWNIIQRYPNARYPEPGTSGRRGTLRSGAR